MASGPPFPPPYDPASLPPLPQEGGRPPADYRWLAPAALPAQPDFVAGAPARSALYELRPLSTGEVLDRTFSLYRSRFLLFAGIASLSAAVQLIGQAVQLLIAHALVQRGNAITLSVSRNLLSIGASVVFLLAFAITQAATVWAVGEVYMGRSTTVSDALRATAQRWLRYLGIALWQMGSALWPAAAVAAVMAGVWISGGRSFASVAITGVLVLLLLGAFVLGVIFYLRNLLAVPVTVREGSPVRPAMRRSKVLTAGGKGKLFVVLLIAGALYMVMATIIGVAAGVTMVTSHSMQSSLANGNLYTGAFLVVQLIGLALGFVGYTLISPVVMIGITLVYFDQRVRKEAFDVAVLLGEESVLPGGEGAAPASTPYPAAAAPAYAAPEPASYGPSPMHGTDMPSFEPTAHPPAESYGSVAEPSPAEPPVVEPPDGASGL